MARNYHAYHLRHLAREMVREKKAKFESPGGLAHIVNRLLPSLTVAYHILSNEGKGVNMDNT